MSESSRPITIDMIIAKFLPIIGAILFITGLGYLIYTSVWDSLTVMMRLGVGFFVSVTIIGTAFSFSEKLKYFADVVMGGGILLLYGTLLYGSRTTDIATQAAIPEVATLVSAFIFTLGVAYFASLRKSKVILALGMLGAYLTPFILGQNDSWVKDISFNAYLIYFSAVNIVIFFMGREIAVYDLIPLNLFGLFFGTYTLHSLSYSGLIQAEPSFFTSESFTVFLLVVLVIMSIAGIALSSRYFTEKKDEVKLSFGYLVPLAWFLIQMDALTTLSIPTQVVAFLVIAFAYFISWYILRPLATSRYQHIAVYAGGMISLVFAIIALFPEFSVYSSIFIAYIGLIFAVIYVLDGNKGERILASILFSLFGGSLALIHIYGQNSDIVTYPTIFAVFSLVPAILLAVLVKLQGQAPKGVSDFVNIYSVTATVIALFIIIIKFIQVIDFGFAFFVFPGFLIVLWVFLHGPAVQNRGSLMRIGTVLLSIGFFGSFFYFIANLAPHVADDESFFKGGAIFDNWNFIKGVFAVATYFMALSISREIQKTENVDRPSFLLVIIGYTSLLLLVNFSIITICNDLGIVLESGGPRAIGTTIWWIILSISMLLVGIHFGRGYRSEKLLGLILLLLTIAKIAFYDLATMDMDKKIIVLMVVGGFIMIFSYFLQVKGYLKDENSK
ncbi:DUF2339 domain-containing protein [Candidatus Gracilibacteria bacterium]|nr:DUF2339 domain-containing protein [Candidatus Gracilibacteria bacterium]